MKFSVQREQLLKPLTSVANVVERQQTMPVLSHVLLQLEGNTLTMTGTDMEVQLAARLEVQQPVDGVTTVSARKFLDIVKALPDEGEIQVSVEGDRAIVRCGRSRFSLSCLEAGSFPKLEELSFDLTLDIAQVDLKTLLDRTGFAMAHQDVRYYLNGVLLEIEGNHVRAVATDGHRLALATMEQPGLEATKKQVIVPRKGVVSLQKLIGAVDDPVKVELGSNHVRVTLADVVFTTKLIDGRFPDYTRVIPELVDTPVALEKASFKAALHRVAILSNEKYRGVRFQIHKENLGIQADNPEHEEAEEEVAISYEGAMIEIGFNATYLQDALNAIDSEMVSMNLRDSHSSCLLTNPDDESAMYVVMPMRL